MRAIPTTTLAVLTMAGLLGGGAVFALDGGGGYTPALLFSGTEMAADVTYPAGFSGVLWSDMGAGTFGPGGNTFQGDPVVASNGSGDLFVLVNGSRHQRADFYTGVIWYDGAGFTYLTQDLRQLDAQSGEFVGVRTQGIAVPSVTAGKLTAGHPVVLRTRWLNGVVSLEVWSVDPTPSPATLTLVHDLGVGAGGSTLGIDGAGSLYVHRYDEKVYKLAFNGTDYDQTVLATGINQEGIVMGGDGAPYGFPTGATSLWGQGSAIDILRIDPVTGAQTVHAKVRSGQWFRGWTWDSTGRFWIALKDGYRDDYVTEVRAGRTTGTKKAIAKSVPDGIWSIGAGSSGELHVVEFTASFTDVNYFALAPDTGGGGGGGGGNGNGKGKNK